MKKILLVLGLAVILASSSLAMGVGVEGGRPYLRFSLGPETSADVSLQYNSTDSNNNAITLWGRYNSKIAKIGEIVTGWGAELEIESGKTFGADRTVITLTGLVSAAYNITKGITIYGNIDLLSLVSTDTGGTSTTSYMLNNGSFMAYSGIRVEI